MSADSQKRGTTPGEWNSREFSSSNLNSENWDWCYVETGVRSGKSRFRSEAKLEGRQAGIHQGNTSFELVFHFPALLPNFFITIPGAAQLIETVVLLGRFQAAQQTTAFP